MSYKIEEIRKIRKRLGLTQSELAKRSRVSQSLIAKIEAGRIDPAYSSVMKITEALDSMTKDNSKKAEEIMNRKIITVSSDDLLKDCIKKMRKYQISQMPVIDEGKIVGIISESTLIDGFMDKKDNVGEVMGDSPPIITKDTSTEVISGLLRFFQIIIVAEKGKPLGIITKADLLESIYR